MSRKLIMLKIACSTLVLIALTGCGHNPHWVGPAVVGGVIGYSIANQPRVYQEVIIVTPQCHNTYIQRVNACDLKFKNDPHYNYRYRDACISQAKHQYMSCNRP